ncbi:hypothetical protein E4U11_007308 [Claviceps purpurea]|nr:hypothetical protein E4U11_007308 [Claviceps purpurea]
MSQRAPQCGGLPPTSGAYAYSTSEMDLAASGRPYASSSSPPSPSPVVSPQNRSPTTGRSINVPSLSSAGPLPRPAQRSPRPPIPSPLSATSNVATSSASASPSEPSRFWTLQGSQSIGHNKTEKSFIRAPVGQGAYSSEPSSPFNLEEEIQRLRVSSQLNKNSGRSASDPEASKAAHSHNKSTESTTPTTTIPSPSTSKYPHKLPQSPSVHDMSTSTPTASSPKHDSAKASSQEAQHSAEIASIIKAAGSPEAVIQHLLKEKHAQSQQNSQLWRLVDKQRAMIFGLNKDLEEALKDKEKYRKRLKELWSDPAVVKAASAKQEDLTRGIAERGAESPRSGFAVPESRALAASHGPDSPSVDSDSQMNSPADTSVASHPFSRRTEEPHGSPKHQTPNLRQERRTDDADHGTEAKIAGRGRKDTGEGQLREPSYSVSLPTSQSLPSDLSKSPPPKSQATPPSSATPQPSSESERGHSQFSSPRKAPPAPLQLKNEARPDLAAFAAAENDSESEYEDILEDDELDDVVVDENRGRRKTRDDDEMNHEVLAFREAQGGSSPDQTRSESPNRSTPKQHMSSSALPTGAQQEESAPVDALPAARGRVYAVAPVLSPGLPSTPRPFGSNLQRWASTPLSARFGPAAPLSPRPPRQPIAHLPNIMPPVSSSPAEPPNSSALTPSVSKRLVSEGAGRQTPPERTEIYKGLVVEEYPDLLLSPHALPSIRVKVASSRMKPSRASLMFLTQLEEDPVFTLAVLSRADHGELWRIEKDIASLGKLDGRLRNCPAFTARTPERSLFSGHAPAKLDARRVALDQYMEELLDTPFDTATAVELCKYLSTNTVPPNVDEISACFQPTPENSGLSVGVDGRSIRSGYLTKKGKNFGGWKVRFFVLDGPQLKYYETPGGAHLGTIKLQHAQLGKQTANYSNDNQSPTGQAAGQDLDNQYRHAFLILEPKKKDSSSHVKHVLCAESDSERDLWVDDLLPWIGPGPDSRDAEDAELPLPLPQTPATPATPSTAPADNTSGIRPRKSNAGRARHQNEESEALIGVRYDSTHAGEIPLKGPTASPTEPPTPTNPQSIAHETTSVQANKLISGPKDPQIISDSAAWGNKPGYVLPMLDEKKARKRSFFGFGPKTRSSSEGQDSLFGGSENGSVGAHYHLHGHPGSVRPVFGATLAEAVRYNPPLDVRVALPSVVYRCIQYLDYRNAISEEGIFRLSGSNVVIKQLRERFNVEGDVNLITDEQYYDMHAVASLLKLYLRELPTTILTRDLHMDFLSTTEIQDRQEKVARLAELAQLLPLPNATLLKYLVAFLLRIINNAEVNKMNMRNVGIVFSPTLNIPAQVFAMFLQNYQGVFGIEPEEYELPPPVSEAGFQGHVEGMTLSQQQHLQQSQQQQQQHQLYHHPHQPPQKFELPRRPSTSSGSASPHRQARLESVREHSKTITTPPIVTTTAQTSRSTPTPPLGAPYAYEGSYSAGVNHDGQTYRPAPRATSGLDRLNYPSCHEESGMVETQANVQGRRRQSSLMMMGGAKNMQQQMSKGRLREASRY